MSRAVINQHSRHNKCVAMNVPIIWQVVLNVKEEVAIPVLKAKSSGYGLSAISMVLVFGFRFYLISMHNFLQTGSDAEAGNRNAD